MIGIFKLRSVINAWGTGVWEINKIPEGQHSGLSSSITNNPTTYQPTQAEPSISSDIGMYAGGKVAEKAITGGFDKIASGFNDMSSGSTLDAISSVGEFGNSIYTTPGAMASMAQGGATQGLLYPGGMSGPVPSAFSGTGNMGALGNLGTIGQAVPFMALASFVVPKIIDSFFGDKPTISFTGMDPKFLYSGKKVGDSGYIELPSGGIGQKSGKYSYTIGVKDTGQDAEKTQELIAHFDNIFDKLSAEGVPVNELLARNENFAFGGRTDRGATVQSITKNVMDHMAPDIESFKSSGEFADRNITIEPFDPKSVSYGRDNYDAGITKNNYTASITQNGVLPDTSEMSSLDMVKNKHVTDESRLSGIGGNSGSDLDKLYSEAKVESLGNNVSDRNKADMIKNQRGLLESGGRDLYDSANGKNDWWSNYTARRGKTELPPAKQPQENPLPEEQKTEPAGLLNPNRLKQFNFRR